jgi:hypothetical protein
MVPEIFYLQFTNEGFMQKWPFKASKEIVG